MADEKLTGLPTGTPLGDSLLYGVDDPSGTPESVSYALSALLEGPLFLQNLGTDWNLYSLGFGLFRATRLLTDAQVKGLPDSGGPLTIAPAPGAGKVAVPFGGLCYLDWTANYANVNGGCYFGFGWASSGWWASSVLYGGASVNARTTKLLANSADSIATFSAFNFITDDINEASALAGLTPAEVADAVIALVADNNGAGDFTGGDAANTLFVSVDYAIRSLS